jgi:cell division protein FtsB
MKKKFSFAIIFFVIGIILAGVISTRAVQEAYRNRKIEKEVETLKQEAQKIQGENDTIQKKIDYYNTPQFVEKVSKDKMNLQKPDENVVIVSQGASLQTQNETQNEVTTEDNQQISNYMKWWNFFFKYN